MSDNVNYIVRGDGPPVILIHGMSSSLHNWNYVLPRLVESGYRVYALDLLGHGESSKPSEPAAYRFDALYTHLEEWIKGLSLSQAPSLVGHSLGGYLTLKYALENPESTGRIVLVNPYFYRKQLSPHLQRLNRRPDLNARALQLAPLWLVYTLVGWRPHGHAPNLRRTQHQTALDCKRASPFIFNIPHTTPDLSDHLRTIQQPALVVWGDKDITLQNSSFPKLVRELPNARGHQIPGCGHHPHVLRPDVFNRLVLEFLDAPSEER